MIRSGRLSGQIAAGSLAALTIVLSSPDVRAAEPASQPTTAERTRTGGVASRPAEVDDGPVVEGGEFPTISYEDLVLLMQTTRRAMRETLRQLPIRGALYRPPSLKGVEGQVRLALRSAGVVVSEVLTPRVDLIDAAVAAGKQLGDQVRADPALLQRFPRADDGADSCGLELEVYGPREYLEFPYFENGTHWTPELLGAFEPAVQGIGVTYQGKTGRCPPSDIVVNNYTPDLALAAAEKAVGLTWQHKAHDSDAIRYFRFPAVLVWEEKLGAKPVRLVRGDELIPASAVNARSVDAAINRMGAYLRYRQNPSGWFAYEYSPATDRFSDEQSAAGQIRALRGLLEYSRWTGQAQSLEAVKTGVRAALEYLKPMKVGDNDKAQSGGADVAGLVLSIPGRGQELATSSELLAILLELDREGDEFRREIAGLAAGIMVSQDAGGRLEMMFEVGEEQVGTPDDDVAAGTALQAVAAWCGGKRDRSVETLIRRAGDYYGKRLPIGDAEVRAPTKPPASTQSADEDAIAGPVAAAALARGFLASYPLTNSARETDLGFAVLDRFARLQVTSASSPSAELHGAFNVKKLGDVGVDSALCMRALADGVATARRVGDEGRVRRYRAAMELGVRFLMQLEVREPGCFFVRSRRDALGGVRKSLWDNRLRVDDCADVMAALMAARRELYGPRGK